MSEHDEWIEVAECDEYGGAVSRGLERANARIAELEAQVRLTVDDACVLADRASKAEHRIAELEAEVELWVRLTRAAVEWSEAQP